MRQTLPGRTPACPQRTAEPVRGIRSLAVSLIDSLPTNAAILDDHGIIRLTNRAWRLFGKLHNMAYPGTLGMNYLALAATASGYSSESAREASVGIQEVLRRRKREFVVEYPCHTGEIQRWFRLHACPVEGLGPLRVVINHEDITASKTSDDTIRQLEREVEKQRANLETVNHALNVMMDRRAEDKREVEEKILGSLRELVNPYIEKLGKTSLDAEQREFLAIIQTNIQGVTSPLLYRLSSRFFNLTPQEINVANLVMDGKPTKEIADTLCISENAVEFHRKNIRKKMGIRNKRISLRSRLLALEPSCQYQQFHAWKAPRNGER
jgi:DNA-binding CsgD family transcriptional regulator